MPIVCDQYDLCFAHVPKTGGTFVERILLDRLGGRRLAPKHATYRSVERPPDVAVRVFTVREPLSWYRSYWSYARSAMNRRDAWPIWEGGDPRHPTKRLDQTCGAARFPDFVRNVLTEFPDGFLRATYCDFLNGSTLALRSERLREDLELLLAKVGYADATFVRDLPDAGRTAERWKKRAVLPASLERELREVDNLEGLDIPYLSAG